MPVEASGFDSLDTRPRRRGGNIYQVKEVKLITWRGYRGQS